MRYLKISFAFIYTLLISNGLTAEKTDLQFRDYSYEPTIKTVEINSFQPSRGKTDVFPLNSVNAYFLEFDDLTVDADYYFAYLIHCNNDWTRSLYNPIEFLFDYNEFEITDYEFSIDTRVPYTHYRLPLPRVRIPGNYLLVVYRGNNVEDIILSKRFMVFEERIGIGAAVVPSTGVMERDLNQQIDLKINYTAVDAAIPKDEIKVVIRQNQRWDNAITGLKPTFIRADLKELEYRHFNLENNFAGGNEFRFFDIRTLNFRGENVGEVEVLKDRINTRLYLDKSRGGPAYSEPLRQDLNGQFIIANLDNSPPEVTGQYTYVYFSLQSDEISDKIYVLGAMNNWDKTEESLLTYNSNNGLYEGRQLLKQGWYDFLYFVEGPNPLLYEGSYRETRNEYEVLVYYGRTGARGDLLLGYLKITN